MRLHDFMVMFNNGETIIVKQITEYALRIWLGDWWEAVELYRPLN